MVDARGGGTCQQSDRLPGNQDHARARGRGLLSVLNRLVSLLRRFDCFAGWFHIFGRRSCSVLRRWWRLRNQLRRFLGRCRGGGGRWGRCNRNPGILLHFRLAKVFTGAQDNARDKA